MKTKWIEEQFIYDGSQLHSLFAYTSYELLGDSIISWQGPCDVSFEHMVDGEDLLAKAKICGNSMVHFVVEKFNCSLLAAVTLQRLMATIVMDVICELEPTENSLSKSLIREGDDIYLSNKKLSISIATKSPTSSLIHFAVNIVNEGTPVSTLALTDLSIDPITFSRKVMAKFSCEVESIEEATMKVFSVS